MSAEDITPEQVEALARATLAHTFVQLTVHFPAELAALEITPEDALTQALGLAEEAIALAPELPDGHTALGRVLLCHPDPQALNDATEVLERALAIDPEHDPAEIALAVAQRAAGKDAEALAALDRVLKRGSPLPHPLVLRALIHLGAGRVADARRDLERAVQLAPTAGLLRLDAAAAAEADGDRAAAEAHRHAARALLGAAYDDLARGR